MARQGAGQEVHLLIFAGAAPGPASAFIAPSLLFRCLQVLVQGGSACSNASLRHEQDALHTKRVRSSERNQLGLDTGERLYIPHARALFLWKSSLSSRT